MQLVNRKDEAPPTEVGLQAAGMWGCQLQRIGLYGQQQVGKKKELDQHDRKSTEALTADECPRLIVAGTY